MNRKVFNRILKMIAKSRLEALLPEMRSELIAYSKGSDTTGTQPITLFLAVKDILKYRPRRILECGTGSSTVVLALAVQKLKSEDPSYDGKVISMESVEEWYRIAQSNLPDKFKNIVTIVHGPREKYEVSMFRGYIHSNKPDEEYDFVFLDGPNFEDEYGTAFCADVIHVAQKKRKGKLRGVIDGRGSSAFVLQTLFGRFSTRYFMSLMASRFCIDCGKNFCIQRTTDFKAGFLGVLRLGR